YSYFFFQAEDGIRDFHVTGVQTCALPIYPGTGLPHFENVTTTYCRAEALLPLGPAAALTDALATLGGNGEAAVGRAMLWAERLRSEERRVGKEWRWWRSPAYDRETAEA